MGAIDISKKKKEYGFVDVMKFFLSLLIVYAHYISENAVGRVSRIIDYTSSLYVIVVPFFFVCSGFLLFRKLDGQNDWAKVKAYSKKILVMYAGWSIVYVSFNVATWIRFGTTVESVLHYILNAITYSTYKTIWFLPATVIGVLLTYFFYTKCGLKVTCAIAAMYYVVGCLGTSYSFVLIDNALLSKVLNIYNYIFSSSRNGLFNGFPFVVLGLLIAKREEKGFSEENKKNLLMAVMLGIGFIAEAFIIKQKFHAVNVNTLFLLIPFSYFFVSWCLGVQMQMNRATAFLRKMSTNIFLCQRLYLSALPVLFPESFFGRMLTGNPYIGLIYVLLLTLMTAVGLTALSNRNKWFRKFC